MTTSSSSESGRPSRHPAEHYRDGLAAIERGNPVEAIHHFTQIGEAAGAVAVLARYHHSQARWAAGLAALREGRLQDAQEHLREASRLNPNCADLADHLGRSYAVAGRYADAVAAFQQAQGNDAASPVRAIRVALAQWRDGRRDSALATLTEAAAEHPRDAATQFQLGLMRADAGPLASAIDHLRQAVAIDPGHADAHRYLGLMLATDGRMEEAVDALLAAQRLRPTDATLSMELGMALRATRLTPAELLARQSAAAPVNPRDAAKQKAVATLAHAFADEPELIAAFLDLPGGARDDEALELVATAVERAIALQPNYADLHYYAARLAERLGRLEAAVEEDERALALNPGYVQALIHLGRLYAQLQRDDEAIARLERAVAFGGDHADVHFALGELHRRAGRRHRAEAAFRRALDLNAGYAAAREALEAIAAA